MLWMIVLVACLSGLVVVKGWLALRWWVASKVVAKGLELAYSMAVLNAVKRIALWAGKREDTRGGLFQEIHHGEHETASLMTI